MTRVITLTLAAALCAGAASAAGMGPTATGRKFMDLAASPDPKPALAMCAKMTAVVDEFAPHLWTGPDACAHWYAAFGAWAKAEGVDGDKVTLGPAIVSEVDGDTAYVVFAATETWTHAGAPMSEPAHLAYTMRKEGGGWILTSMAWAGGKPHAATPAKDAAADAK